MEILEFDGEKDAYWWLICTEKHLDAMGMPEAEKLAVAVKLLRDRALKWWQWWGWRHPQASWPVFTLALLWRFKPEYRDVLPLSKDYQEPDLLEVKGETDLVDGYVKEIESEDVGLMRKNQIVGDEEEEPESWESEFGKSESLFVEDDEPKAEPSRLEFLVETEEHGEEDEGKGDGKGLIDADLTTTLSKRETRREMICETRRREGAEKETECELSDQLPRQTNITRKDVRGVWVPRIGGDCNRSVDGHCVGGGVSGTMGACWKNGSDGRCEGGGRGSLAWLGIAGEKVSLLEPPVEAAGSSAAATHRSSYILVELPWPLAAEVTTRRNEKQKRGRVKWELQKLDKKIDLMGQAQKSLINGIQEEGRPGSYLRQNKGLHSVLKYQLVDRAQFNEEKKWALEEEKEPIIIIFSFLPTEANDLDIGVMRTFTIMKYGSIDVIQPLATLWLCFDCPCGTCLPRIKIGKKLVTGLEAFLSVWKREEEAPLPTKVLMGHMYTSSVARLFSFKQGDSGGHWYTSLRAGLSCFKLWDPGGSKHVTEWVEVPRMNLTIENSTISSNLSNEAGVGNSSEESDENLPTDSGINETSNISTEEQTATAIDLATLVEVYISCFWDIDPKLHLEDKVKVLGGGSIDRPIKHVYKRRDKLGKNREGAELGKGQIEEKKDMLKEGITNLTDGSFGLEEKRNESVKDMHKEGEERRGGGGKREVRNWWVLIRSIPISVKGGSLC